MNHYIGQLVRPDGHVLTEQVTSHDLPPGFGYAWGDHRQPGFGTIRGEVYGRFRREGDDAWMVVYYWPDGPDSLPMYCDHTGKGSFLSMNPDDMDIPRGDTPAVLYAVGRPAPAAVPRPWQRAVARAWSLLRDILLASS